MEFTRIDTTFIIAFPHLLSKKICIELYSIILYCEFMDEFLTTLQIAKILGIHVITVRRWIEKGQLSAYQLDKGYRVKRSEFDKFLEARKVKKS